MSLSVIALGNILLLRISDHLHYKFWFTIVHFTCNLPGYMDILCESHCLRCDE